MGCVPNLDANRFVDLRNAGSGIRTDRADRIHPTVVGADQQRDGARLGCPAPLDTRSSRSELLPHDTARRMFARPFSQIAARANGEV